MRAATADATRADAISSGGDQFSVRSLPSLSALPMGLHFSALQTRIAQSVS
jgi:hypothetical protein